MSDTIYRLCKIFLPSVLSGTEQLVQKDTGGNTDVEGINADGLVAARAGRGRVNTKNRLARAAHHRAQAAALVAHHQDRRPRHRKAAAALCVLLAPRPCAIANLFSRTVAAISCHRKAVGYVNHACVFIIMAKNS